MAIVSPNLSLAIWNLPGDRYNHDQLADNWAKVDFHDHSPGRGIQIPTEGIKDGAITAAKIAPGANAIQDGSVTTSKFGSLPATKVYNSAVRSVLNGTSVALTFDNERFDTNNIHSTSVNTSRLTFQTPGTYFITGSIVTDVNPGLTGGFIRTQIRKNGTLILAGSGLGVSSVSHTISTFAKVSFNDYIEIVVTNTTGGTVNVTASSATEEDRHDFGAVWISP